MIYWKIILWQVFPTIVECFSDMGQCIIARIQTEAATGNAL